MRYVINTTVRVNYHDVTTQILFLLLATTATISVRAAPTLRWSLLFVVLQFLWIPLNNDRLTQVVLWSSIFMTVLLLLMSIAQNDWYASIAWRFFNDIFIVPHVLFILNWSHNEVLFSFIHASSTSLFLSSITSVASGFGHEMSSSVNDSRDDRRMSSCQFLR